MLLSLLKNIYHFHSFLDYNNYHLHDICMDLRSKHPSHPTPSLISPSQYVPTKSHFYCDNGSYLLVNMALEALSSGPDSL